jgi:Rad3-related DNA helicase
MPLQPPPKRIPQPVELGLPEKFQSWRPSQEEFINVIITSDKRVNVGCAPTGFGKSPAVVGAALYTKRPTCIVTASKALQRQYLDDFESCGMVNLMGRNNYQCSLRDDYSCEEGTAASCPYRGSVSCPSSAAEIAAASSPLVITNYSKWTKSRKYGTGMQHFTQVIFDEGDEGPDAIAAEMQVVLNAHEVSEDLGLDFPKQHEAEEMPLWKHWSRHASTIAEEKMNVARARITGVSNPKPSWVKKFTHMRNLLRRLIILRSAVSEDWIVEEIKDGYQFDPIRIGRYAESTLLLQVPHVVFVSATIRPKTMYTMGIPRRDFEFREFDSDFPSERCPVYYIPTMRADAKAESWSQMWLKHDQIAGKRQDRNGVVHTISYNRQQELVQSSRFSEKMIYNERGKPLADKMDDFFSTYPGAILVSPSVETGYDFRFKRAEWQFICKIPFDPPSKILKAREADDKEYRSAIAMRRIVQAVGRGMREKTDQCETFIGDEHLEWFYPRYQHLAPNYFKLQKIHTLPPPPPRLTV